MRRKSISEKEVRTILAVFEGLVRFPYDNLNTFLGSLTITEMHKLNLKLKKWYKGENNED